MKKLTYLLFLIIFVTNSCKQENIDEQYNENITFKDSLQCTYNVLNDSCIFIRPNQMEVFDTIIVVLDKFHLAEYFHIYNKNGKYLKAFGRRGRGPGELISASNFHANKEDETIQVYNMGKRQIIEYNLKAILNNEETFCKTYDLSYTTYPLEIIKYSNENYLFCDPGTDIRYAIYDQKEIKDSCSAYPRLENSDEYTPAIMGYASIRRFSPDFTKFVHATYIGAVMDFFTIKNDKIIPQNTCRLYYPKYKIVDKKRHDITWDESTKIGFECLYTTNSYIYSLLNGILGADLKKDNVDAYTKNISVFDWQGKPYKLIKSTTMLNAICVDEKENCIYAIAYNEGEHSLIRIAL